MDPRDFRADSPGRLVNQNDYWAYVPAPLPPSLPLTWDLTSQIVAGAEALKELVGTTRSMQNPRLLADPFMRREAILRPA